MSQFIEAVGCLASLTGFIVGLPHARRVWANRYDHVKLSGIAMSSQVIGLFGGVMWVIYAFGIQSFWVGAPQMVNIPIAILTITILTQAKRRTVDEPIEPLLPFVPTQRPAPADDRILVAA